ncbi:MAG: Fe-S protein assembly co-chaperone HscB [Alphaproteobacteria bacterium]|nr:Fe-S protein assembly co-chaperone HscB [Alphaproteobacteria bacterium]
MVNHSVFNQQEICWNCRRSLTAEAAQCSQCKIFIDPQACSYFELLDVPETFDVDSQVLEKHYLEIQQRVHPDQFANRSASDKERSLDYITHVNDAYFILSSPIKRAIHLLNRFGVWMDNDELAISKNPALLMEVMELREAVAEAKDFAGLNQLIIDLKQKEKKLEQALHDAFSSKNWAEAAKETLTLQYISKIVKDARQQLIKHMS